MSFLKKHGFGAYSPFISFLFISCASRGPSYAAREELYEKSLQPVVVEKHKEAKVALLEDDEEWLSEGRLAEKASNKKSDSLSSAKMYRSISSQKTDKSQKITKAKKSKTYSRVVGNDDLDLNIVPATSSPSGQGFLINN